MTARTTRSDRARVTLKTRGVELAFARLKWPLIVESLDADSVDDLPGA
jgi:hypothetical protein